MTSNAPSRPVPRRPASRWRRGAFEATARAAAVAQPPTSSTAPGRGAAPAAISSKRQLVELVAERIALAGRVEQPLEHTRGRLGRGADERALLREAERAPAAPEDLGLGTRPARLGVEQQPVVVEDDAGRARGIAVGCQSHEIDRLHSRVADCARPERLQVRVSRRRRARTGREGGRTAGRASSYAAWSAGVGRYGLAARCAICSAASTIES